jgi:pantetheine-phosphate adenylyltransferase
MITQNKKCVFAGTFDPPTTGHKSMIDTCLTLFDEVVVAVMKNTAKTPFFTEEERVTLLNKLYKNNPHVRVVVFEGAVVDLLQKEQTPFYVRGVRNTIDFEYENQNYFASKKLMPELVTLYIPAEQDKLQVSSTLVKNSVRFQKDFLEYIPKEITSDVLSLLESKHV